MDTSGSVDSCRDNGCMDGSAGEGHAGVVTTSGIEDIGLSNSNNRYFKSKIK